MYQLTPTKKQLKTSDEIHYENELIKRRYFDHLKQALGYSQKSILTYEGSILQWQDLTQDADFRAFDREMAIRFKESLANNKGRSGNHLSTIFQYQTVRKVRDFFSWLSRQDGYRQYIKENDVEFLKLNQQNSRLAYQGRRRMVPSLETVKKVIESIHPITETDRRDRALLCFTLITGARISAIISLPMRAFDPNEGVVDQDPAKGVKTKFNKRITTALLPIDYKEAQRHFVDWYKYLKSERGFTDNDPIFPATKVIKSKENVSFFNSGEVEPTFWLSSNPARKVFEERFKAIGEPSYNPHSFRHLIVKMFMKKALTEEQKKAISQNLGHENVGTTFGSYGYGRIDEGRQIELLQEIDTDKNSTLDENRIERIVSKIMENKMASSKSSTGSNPDSTVSSLPTSEEDFGSSRSDSPPLHNSNG